MHTTYEITVRIYSAYYTYVYINVLNYILVMIPIRYASGI